MAQLSPSSLHALMREEQRPSPRGRSPVRRQGGAGPSRDSGSDDEPLSPEPPSLVGSSEDSGSDDADDGTAVVKGPTPQGTGVNPTAPHEAPSPLWSTAVPRSLPRSFVRGGARDEAPVTQEFAALRLAGRASDVSTQRVKW